MASRKQIPKVMTVPLSPQDASAYFQRLADLEARLARYESKELGPIPQEQIGVGMRIAAKVGSNSYVSAEIVDIYKSMTSGTLVYDVRRLDGGKKGLGLKQANEIFPPERAKQKV